jgi:glycosyl transferase family 25
VIDRYVINLADRTDRRAEMTAQLARIGWSAEFSNSRRPTDAAGFESIGARGCFLSHLAVLKRGLACGNHVLIMEDDLDFSPDFPRHWNAALADLTQREWAMFYLGHFIDGLADGLTRLQPDHNVLCTHFLMIHAGAIQTFVEGLELMLSRPAGHPEGGPMHVDGAYSTIRAQNPTLATYAYAPSLGLQRPSRSDIAAHGLLDRIAPLRPAMQMLRKVKRALKV